MKKLFLLFVSLGILTSISCGSEKYNDYDQVKKERDSLRNIVRSLEGKYIFDEVKVITNAKAENTFLPGSNYELEIYFVAFNKNSFFVEYDSLNKIDTIYPDSYGIMNFSKKLKEGKNKIEGFLTTNNKFGETTQGILSDVISTKDD